MRYGGDMVRSQLSVEPGSPEEIARFKALQRRMRDMFLRFRGNQGHPHTAVVVPSLSLDPRELAKIDGVAHYEERSLFNLMLLRLPRLRVIYVTSKRLAPSVVDYYLHHMRGVPPDHARRRLLLLDCDDASPRPLTQKILERPRVLERLREGILNPEWAHIVVFNSTPLERTLAVELGIPLYACDPDLSFLGTKTGSREAFADAGIPMPPGRENLADVDALVEGVADLWEEHPETQRMVVKLNDGFSGEGNAILDLRQLEQIRPGASGAIDRRDGIRQALPQLRFEAKGEVWEHFAQKFQDMGGICECWLEGEDKASPSCQLRITPAQEVQSISTHDQVLGGASGQVFQGATFPAHGSYRLRVQEMGKTVGRVLADKGAIGRFSVDFLAIRKDDPTEVPDLYAVEINLRQGGTTHPFNTLKFLTDGTYDEETGLFYTAQGQRREYFATDTLCHPEYKGLLPMDLIDLLVTNGVHFRSDETGVVFHLMGCLSEFGKVGCTSIAPTVGEAQRFYDEMVILLDRYTGRSDGLDTSGRIEALGSADELRIPAEMLDYDESEL